MNDKYAELLVRTNVLIITMLAADITSNKSLITNSDLSKTINYAMDTLIGIIDELDNIH